MKEKRIPSVVRHPMGASQYHNTQHQEDIELVLSSGDSPLKPPQAYYDAFDKLVRSGELAEAGVGYKHHNMQPVEEYLRHQYRIRKDASIIFSGSGSDGSIIDFIKLVHHEQNTVQVWGLGPHFPGINQAINSFRDTRDYDLAAFNTEEGEEGKNPPEERLLYGPVMSSLRESEAFERYARIKKTRNIDRVFSMAKAKRENDERTEKRAQEGERPINYVWYGGNPVAPLGTHYDRSHMLDFVRYTGQKGDMFLEDEVFLTDKKRSLLSMVGKYSNLAVVDGWAKKFRLGGMRLGITVVPEEIGEQLKKIERPFINGFTAVMANEMSKTDALDSYLKTVGPQVAELNKPFLRGLSQIDGVEVLDTENDVFIQTIRVPYDGRNLSRRLRKSGLDAAPGEGFGDTHYELEEGNTVRIVTPKTREDGEKALEIIGKALRS